MSIKINKNGTEYPIGVIPQNYPATNIGYNNSDSGLSATDTQGAIDELRSAGNVMMSDGQSIEQAITNKTAPASNVVMVTLPTVAQYGYYYFFLPTSAIKAGKTITINSATLVGSSTNLAQYVSPESYTPTEMGQIYKIASSAVGTGGQALIIIFSVS